MPPSFKLQMTLPSRLSRYKKSPVTQIDAAYSRLDVSVVVCSGVATVLADASDRRVTNTGFASVSVLQVACVLAFCLIPGPISAQSVQGPASAPTAGPVGSTDEIQAIKERVSSWLKTCLQDWDMATHMSRKEWEVTCQRVASERGKLLLENRDVLLMPPKGR